MKKALWKRTLAIAIAAAMLTGAFAGCKPSATVNPEVSSGGTGSASSGASPTRVDNPVTLTWMVTESPDWSLSRDIATWDKIAEATNVTVKWKVMPQADAASVYTTTMASGKSNWPDLVCTKIESLNSDGEAGAFVPLEDLMPQKLSNALNALMSQDPATFVTLADTNDDHLYGIPSIGLSRNAMSWMIRGDWLKDLGLKEPDTIDEFTNVLRAFRDKDPGHAGQYNTPLVIRGGIQSLYVNAMCSWGFHNVVYTRDAKTGACTINATQNGFRDMVKWLKLLYDEKLIDQEFATADAARWESYINNSYAGATMDFTVRTDQFTKNIKNPSADAVKAGVAADSDASFIGLTPLAGPNGARGIGTNNTVNTTNTVGITKNCKDVDAACALINYIYSDEGIKLLSWGEDGVTYKGTDSSGNPQWISDIGAAGQYSVQKTAQYGIQQPFMSRVITDAEVTLAYGPLSAQALEKNRPYWLYNHGPIKWTDQESNENNDYMTDLGPFIIQSVAEFMTGVRTLDDAGWNTFQKQLKDYKADECANLYTVGRNAGNEMAKQRLAKYGIEAPQWMLDT